MDISSALDILRTATDESLRSHSAQTILTLRNVGERLKASLLPDTVDGPEVSTPPFSDSVISTAASPSSLVEDDSSTSMESISREPHSRDDCTTRTPVAPKRHLVSSGTTALITAPQESMPLRGKSRKAPVDVVSSLVSAMQKSTVSSIWHTSRSDIKSIISRKRAQHDRRLEDIRRVEGDPKSSDEAKLLRLLGIRSYALEFTTETKSDTSKSRVDELVAYVQSISGGNDKPNDHASQFKGRSVAVSNFVEHRQSNPHMALANRAIHNGIKHLVFEKVLQDKLRALDLPDMCEVVSAILGLSINHFRSLPYKRIPELVDALLSDGMQISLKRDDESENEEKHVLDIIRSMNPWFTQLQVDYDSEHSTLSKLLGIF
ncbi:hypothetical protein N7492_002053 [Penicillium capsulatum]|uniref:Uncharacterized protein n=1 Tax=Penicillium capsulatum TaxID=69766 RepID=A0A9W9IGU3_9EURO|nr:hypothetical protein N7492_002053 [Penicillium capsulatum]KAJ6123327.1 hypothetical protein N7512_005792 [Penicillium capsulatum]